MQLVRDCELVTVTGYLNVAVWWKFRETFHICGHGWKPPNLNYIEVKVMRQLSKRMCDFRNGLGTNTQLLGLENDALIDCLKNPQMFSVYFRCNLIRRYLQGEL